MSHEKVKRAASLLRSAGIESARAGVGQDGAFSVMLTAEDALKMLLLTDSDAAKLLDGERMIRGGVMGEVRSLKKKLERLEKLASHSPELCKKGEHILDSYATGGRDGHVRTNCLACDYSQDGYD